MSNFGFESRLSWKVGRIELFSVDEVVKEKHVRD